MKQSIDIALEGPNLIGLQAPEPLNRQDLAELLLHFIKDDRRNS